MPAVQRKRLGDVVRDWRFVVLLSIFSAAVALVSALQMLGEVRLVSIALLFAADSERARASQPPWPVEGRREQPTTPDVGPLSRPLTAREVRAGEARSIMPLVWCGNALGRLTALFAVNIPRACEPLM